MIAVVAALLLLFPGQSTFLGTHTIHGSITITNIDNGSKMVGAPCAPFGEFLDVQPGMRVLVRDRERRLLAETTLSGGHVFNQRSCQFTFTLNVPHGDYYRIYPGSLGVMEYRYVDIVRSHWRAIMIIMNP